MTNILLVAKREFRQIATMRSFWLTLLLIPVALLLGPVIGRALDDDEASRVMFVDRSGGAAAAAVEERFGRDYDRQVLRSLARHAQRFDLQDAAPDAPWASADRWYTDADVAAFRDAGGVEGAIAALDRVKAEDTPSYDPPERDFAFVDPPAALTGASGEDFQREVDALLDAEDDSQGADIVVLLGEDYAQNPQVRLWSNERPRTDFVTTLQDELTTDLRNRLLAQQGVSADTAGLIQQAAPAIAVTTPEPGGGAREAVLVRSIIPLGLSYVLLMSLLLSGSWMLQSSVEERSNKLIESVLACVRADELMYGKLIGTVAIGLSMVAVWVACAAVAVFFTQGAIADMIRPALAPLTSPSVVLAMIYFFVLGYIMISIILLAIGAMCDTMSEAQGFFMPVMLALMLPVFYLLQATVMGGGGFVERLLTWIPLWTPFAVLARLGTGIPMWEMAAVGLLLAAFTALEFILLGRLFRASLLAQGQKPTLKVLADRLRRAPD